jgi:Transcription factor TFIID complex subunit 8 C-term
MVQYTMDGGEVRDTPPKRKLSHIEETSAPKRQRRSYHQHHALKHKPQSNPSNEPALLEPEAVDKLLIEAIKDVLEEAGLKQDIYDPQIESLALEALRNEVDEYILNICSKVRRSMLVARRIAPIATDFESAIHALEIPRPDDQLLSFRTKPDINPPLLPTPPPDDPFHESAKLPASLLGPQLNDQNNLKRFSINTSSLPPLPSAHTYKGTAVFPQRETDTRRIRELATEEGKLGEQALRRLAGAVKLDSAHPLEHESRKEQTQGPLLARPGRRRRKPDPTEEVVFEDTMRDLLKAEPEAFELGPIVTSEKGYRMPDDARVTRRPQADKGKAAAIDSTGEGQDRRRTSPEVMDL